MGTILDETRWVGNRKLRQQVEERSWLRQALSPLRWFPFHRRPTRWDVLILGEKPRSWARLLTEDTLWRDLPVRSVERLRDVTSFAKVRRRSTFILPLKEIDIHALPPGCWTSAPSTLAMETFADKVRFARYVHEQRLARFAPQAFLPDQPEFPLVVKLAQSTNSRGVAVVGNRAELEDLLLTDEWVGEPYLLQALVSAAEEFSMYGVAVAGRIVWSRSYRFEVAADVPIRVPTAALTSERVTTRRSEEEVFERFLQPLRYDGPFVVDYRRSADGSPLVLEINPRIGGTLLRPENRDDLKSAIRVMLANARRR